MKVELHLHTSEVSRCGHVCAVDAVRAYKEQGYGCIVVTDHFSPSFVDKWRLNGFSDLKSTYLEGYMLAKEEGERIGLNVLLGTEVCLEEANNDYLVYGVDPEMFDHPEILKLSIGEFSKYCNEKGMLLYQAHPFRNHMKIVKPELLFGMEVNNGNPRHNSRNQIASTWATMNNLHRISGSDYHQSVDVGRGGILTNKDILTNQDLLDVLKNDLYTLITV